MKYAVISDIHIKNSEDESYQLLLSFLSKRDVQESSTWYFLGDIFDMMVGNHQEYLDVFPEFFSTIDAFLTRGGSIHYLEGNHDFNLRKLFNTFLKDKNEKFHYHEKAFTQDLDGSRFYFCHGDDIQTGDYGYIFLKNFLRNPISSFIIDKLMSFPFLQNLGKFMSGNSRKYSQTDQLLVKEKFRKFAVRFLHKNPCDFLICGHSHVLDDCDLTGGRYINLGFPPMDKKYLLIDGPDVQLMPLN
jgi:UDP-2,3-diacylglucosamine hydrolase